MYQIKAETAWISDQKFPIEINHAAVFEPNDKLTNSASRVQQTFALRIHVCVRYGAVVEYVCCRRRRWWWWCRCHMRGKKFKPKLRNAKRFPDHVYSNLVLIVFGLSVLLRLCCSCKQQQQKTINTLTCEHVFIQWYV